VGYGTGLVTYYRNHIPNLPCGAANDQNMAIYCPSTGEWDTYIENTLTATINSMTSVTNCHEDMYGDYTDCETENH